MIVFGRLSNPFQPNVLFLYPQLISDFWGHRSGTLGGNGLIMFQTQRQISIFSFYFQFHQTSYEHYLCKLVFADQSFFISQIVGSQEEMADFSILQSQREGDDQTQVASQFSGRWNGTHDSNVIGNIAIFQDGSQLYLMNYPVLLS